MQWNLCWERVGIRNKWQLKWPREIYFREMANNINDSRATMFDNINDLVPKKLKIGEELRYWDLSEREIHRSGSREDHIRRDAFLNYIHFYFTFIKCKSLDNSLQMCNHLYR